MAIKNNIFLKENVIKVFKSESEVAKFFGINIRAVYQWAPGKPIPRARQMELQLKMPDKFPQEGVKK